MGYETMRLRGVSNHYGARDTGGTQGVNPDYAGYSINFDGPRLNFILPVSAECATVITGVNSALTVGAITALTVGGVDVSAATEDAPIVLPKGNTGVVVATGPTAGTLIIKYSKFMG